MQTFLPSPNFVESASLLDTKTLGKQRYDNLELMDTLIYHSSKFAHHPATLMWRGYEAALLDYQYAICYEWHIMRGYEDECLRKTIDSFYTSPWLLEDPSDPWWLGDEAFHLAHQSHLLSVDPEHYENMFAKGLRRDLAIHWPTDY